MPALREDLVIQEGDWATLGEAASELRRRVFIEEQQVPRDEEWDGRDADCRHFLALHLGEPVGTARLLPDAHIGRVAVLSGLRGQGIGVLLMRAAIAAAHREGHPAVELAAQTHALPFYQRLGFQAFGNEFMDAGIAHRNMRLIFTD
ncbi:GNAT family N-acetyltransferase [Halomonas urumqiensis]|uniref:GNAT family N-acetyltransferase n=1 Tax=Halomonas urumqiensis TaxID=1684789 RepID=A0A2N7UDX0_9GAMM|nr:GNAT family N-acetyltransferase [Halomonas urumqiensis]PMR78591.1 GNAT family N-acetyltransferase [Halomonas urumqiensis]PTB03735.1 GNAT family N-acetyltransferase [Halomonas urumqiensis]GHE20044.1 acetyltransferase [Halomonas urumqiensis]